MAKKRKAGTVRIDFSNVKEGGGGVRVPEDDYHMKIASVKEDISEKSGSPMLVFQWAFVDKKLAKKGTVRDNIVLRDQDGQPSKSLFRLRDLLEALGVDAPKAFDLPIKPLVGKECGVTLVDGEPYKNRIKSEVAGFLSLEDFESDGIDDDDDADDDDADGLEEMNRDELKAYIKSEGLDVRVKKSMSDDDIREAIQEEEGDEDDEDEDDDDDGDIDDLNLDDL